MNQPSSKPTHSQTDAAPLESITLDCDHVLTHAGGDPELLMRLCGVFLNELPIHLKALRSAIKDHSTLLTERALQQLRNCLLIFGSGPVSSTAESLEAAVRGGRKQQVQQEWNRLDRQIQVLVPQVQRLMLEMATPKTAVQ
jgi:hypothetical protein